MDIERCERCNRLYEVAEWGGAMPGTKEKEDIVCPYCGFTYEKMSNGTFRTFKLTPEQEASYLKGRGH
ncbi:MAG: hypothetical protein PHT31_01805 [Candidatus Omnitrophica bacterium]|nr:hypothetical protein [Candidatus Omnitrophota bacterium]